MADNVDANAGSGGAKFVTALLTFSGDSANASGVFEGILSGSEGSWTYALKLGGAGAVAAGVQRMTLASDDPAVAALQIIDDVVYVDDADWTDSTSKHVLIGGLYQSTPQTITDGDVGPLQTDANGNLKVNIANAAAAADIGVLVDDAAFTPASSKVMVVGFEADEASIDSVDEGDAGAGRMTLDRKQIVTTQPHALGGLSIFRSIDLDEGTLEVVKNAPGCLYGIWVTNLSTTTRFIKFYDATSGTAGTGTPVITLAIPGNASDDVAAMFASGNGIQFATGICVGAVTGVADNDTGAPGANDVVINCFYK